VVDTRAGKILKLNEIPSNNEDAVNGISPRVQDMLKDS
jgi:hypothetical protein